MVEYMVVLVFVTGVIVYAIMGNFWNSESDDPDSENRTVISVLNDNQHEFARDIYQP